MIEIESATACKPVQSSHIKRVEQSTSVLFPESYLRFMEIGNGGVPVRRKLNLGDKAITIQRFLHLVPYYKTNNDLGRYDIGLVHSHVFYVMGFHPFGLGKC